MLALILFAAALEQPLSLRCEGVASYRQLGWIAGDLAAVPASSRQLVDVEIGPDGGRVRLPVTMTPPLNHGKGGWFPLSDVAVSDAAISGRFRLTIVNKPAVTIDRTTGDVDIRGSGGLSFQGRCEKASHEAKF